jgi:hypothetical protein
MSTPVDADRATVAGVLAIGGPVLGVAQSSHHEEAVVAVRPYGRPRIEFTIAWELRP